MKHLPTGFMCQKSSQLFHRNWWHEKWCKKAPQSYTKRALAAKPQEPTMRQALRDPLALFLCRESADRSEGPTLWTKCCSACVRRGTMQLQHDVCPINWHWGFVHTNATIESAKGLLPSPAAIVVVPAHHCQFRSHTTHTV